MNAKVIAVYSTKGGVGKSTTAVNLAWQAAADGSPVLVWDLDAQATATWLLQTKQKLRGGVDALIRKKHSTEKVIRESHFDRIDVLPGDASYRDLELTLNESKKPVSRIASTLKPLRNDYDVIILDCPPGTSLIAQNALEAADIVVLPLIPQPVALRSIEQVRDFMKEIGKTTPLVAFLNQVDRRKAAHRELIEQLPAADEEISDITVSYTTIVEKMGEHRAPIGAYAPRSAPQKAFAGLWNRIKRS